MYFLGDFSVLLLVGALVAAFVKLSRLSGRIARTEGRLAALSLELDAVRALKGRLTDPVTDPDAPAQSLPPPLAPRTQDLAASSDQIGTPDGEALRPSQGDAPTGGAMPPPLYPVSPAPAYVFKAATLTALMTWLKTNWTLAIAALSLMLGGLFMVQYGIENGLLSPKLRVLGTLALGAAFIGGGEWLRRRFGDQHTATASLPSTLSGAGVVVLFIGVLSAYALYGLIGSLTALLGLAAVSMAALLMGWVYGAALSTIGIIGAVAAPFLVSGEAESARLLYPYFALIALTGLAIDSFKRRAWISALALAAPSAGVMVLWQWAPDAPGLAVAALALALGAVMIPERRLLPTPLGDTVGEQLLRNGTAGFPARLGFAGMAIASAAGVAMVADAQGMAQAWIGYGLLAVLAIFAGIWLAPARALADLSVPPVMGVLLALAAAPFTSTAAPRLENGVGLAPGETVVALVSLGAVLSLVAFWRMRLALAGAATGSPVDAMQDPVQESSAALARYFAFGAALVLPATLLILDLFWSDRFAPYYLPPETPPAPDFWGFGWAVTVLCGAALMVVFAQRRLHGVGGQKPDAEQAGARFDAGLFAASACVLMTLALFVLLTKSALTLALAVLVLAAALLYRRLAMAPLAWVFQLGTALIGYRLLADPGVIWSFDTYASGADLISVIVAHLGPLAAFLAVVRLIPRTTNPLMRATAESAALNTASLLVMVLLARGMGDKFWSHWGFGLMAAIWAGSTFAQVYRRRESTGAAKLLRTVFAWVSGAVAAGMALLMLIGLMMLVQPWGFFGKRFVSGPPILDSLALALLPLAATLGVGAYLLYRAPLGTFARRIRTVLFALAGSFGALWGWFEIRRLWRGQDLSVGAVSDGELYSYTIAMLAVSLALLGGAVLRRSVGLRKLAMAGVALTIAKVFLVDMSGLSGLTRVASFVGLGLALTALAWLNRKITEIWDRGQTPS